MNETTEVDGSKIINTKTGNRLVIRGHLQKLLMQDIDPMEDDVDTDEFQAFSSGAKTSAYTTQARAKNWAGKGKLALSQGVSLVGHTAKVTNYAQTGSIFSVANSGASAALAPVVSVTGPIGIAFSLLDSGLSAYSAHKTARHIRNLEKIIEEQASFAKEGTLEAIIFCIKKKNSKLKKKKLGCIPVLGSLPTTMFTAGRSIQKRLNGTRGVARRQMASMLWQNTLLGCPCAIAACKELLGIKIYTLIEGLHDGHLVLKKKMRSV